MIGSPSGRRVAMVVNNGVEGDSRVQRIARSAADAGWDVLLLGRSATGGTERLRIAGLPTVLVAPDRSLSATGRAELRRRDAVAGRRGARLRHGAWRLLDPWVQSFELAAAPHLEDFAPDLVHAHDRHTLPLAARSVAFLRARGRPAGWLSDVHEDVGATAAREATGLRGALRRRMVIGQQAEFLPDADAVVTVSDTLANRLATNHRLRELPTVVLNSPWPGPSTTSPSLRALTGLGRDVPLLVYAGGCAPQRGVANVIEALVRLDDVHLALVCASADPDAAALLAQAEALKVAERVHRVDYVPADQVVPLLRGADVGLVPLLHRPNHEISLVTKYLEYLHAGLPVVTSDVREMAAFTSEHELGAVYPAGDVDGLAGGVRRVLADRVRVSARVARSPAVAETAWPRQAGRLLALYDLIAPG